MRSFRGSVSSLHYEQTTFAKHFCCQMVVEVFCRQFFTSTTSLTFKEKGTVGKYGSLIQLEWCCGQCLLLPVFVTTSAFLVVDVSLHIVDSLVVSLLDKLLLSVCRGDDDITLSGIVVVTTSTV